MTSETFTVETLKARAELAGITIDEEYLEDLASTMEKALAPLRKLDPEILKWVEPALTFDAFKP
jgi:hypothetical protein